MDARSRPTVFRSFADRDGQRDVVNHIPVECDRLCVKPQLPPTLSALSGPGFLRPRPAVSSVPPAPSAP